jgi:L-ascorbate metabolism protein UlaG (beta-lactamase superfamily)
MSFAESFFIALVVSVAVAFLSRYLLPQLGGRARGKRLTRMQASPHWRSGRFRNPIPTRQQTQHGLALLSTIADFFKSAPDRAPASPIPNIPIEVARARAGSDHLAVTWLGHSILLIEIGQTLILTDPMFSRRASPFSFLGPEAFPYERPFTLDDMPEVDAVLLSHDHYDHLDYRTVRELRERVPLFIVPLGVGAHLERWGVPGPRIIELDWDEETRVGDVTVSATPARHFSGRRPSDRMRTLFAAYAIGSPARRVFYCSDSGYFPGLAQIGARHGPFDLTLLGCGGYSVAWTDVHMTPEQTVRAHLDLRGEALLPIHWAKFNLSVHPWIEPVERLLAAAAPLQVRVTTPRPGERVVHGADLPEQRWW